MANESSGSQEGARERFLARSCNSLFAPISSLVLFFVASAITPWISEGVRGKGCKKAKIKGEPAVPS